MMSADDEAEVKLTDKPGAEKRLAWLGRTWDFSGFVAAFILAIVAGLIAVFGVVFDNFYDDLNELRSKVAEISERNLKLETEMTQGNLRFEAQIRDLKQSANTWAGKEFAGMCELLHGTYIHRYNKCASTKQGKDSEGPVEIIFDPPFRDVDP